MVRRTLSGDPPTANDTETSTALRNRSIAHTLMIELLAYQLALPVRWIETQNHLLNHPSTISRYIEIGAKTTLSTMAKRTHQRHTASHIDTSLGRLQFLSYSDNKDEIYYNYHSLDTAENSSQHSLQLQKLDEKSFVGVEKRSVKVEDGLSSATASVSVSASVPALASAPVGNSSSLVAASGSVNSAVEIPALSAADILYALTAQKLKRAFNALQKEKSIQELSGGKSTLQNELIGDLTTEFTTLPDSLEYTPLSTVSQSPTLQFHFTGKPGKAMSSLISKLISRKMPAGFNQAAMQEHLEGYWGISREKSMTVICFAVTIEPISRLETVDSAKEFLNGLVGRFATYSGIELRPVVNGGGSDGGEGVGMVDSGALESVRKEQRDFNMKHFRLLEQYLQVDKSARDQGSLEALLASSKIWEDKIDRWSAEFDDQFFNGIEPLFDARKARRYDSWWDWVREDTVRLLNELALGWVEIDGSPEDDDRLFGILRRWDSSCAEIVTDFLNSVALGDPAMQQTLVPVVAKEILRLGSQALANKPVYRHNAPTSKPRTLVSLTTGNIELSEIPREVKNYVSLIKQGRLAASGIHVPYIHLKKRGAKDQEWRHDQASTKLLMETLDTGSGTGLTFAGKTVLVTGAGPKSIGADVVQGLLNGGAQVIVTTSRAVSSAAEFFNKMYRDCGAKGSTLTVVPFNQGSKKDCEALVEYIYGPKSPTGGDLDYIIPFAAIPEKSDLSNLDSMSELAHRAMLVNLLRILGLVHKEKEQRRMDSRTTNIVVPLSFNKGGFGGDGLYPESKLGLETLFNRFYSGTWSEYITICGAVIGWVRDTSLSHALSLVGHAIEQINDLNVITFSRAEMAFNILALMTPAITDLCETQPVYADLTGGADEIPNIKEVMVAARKNFTDESDIRKALLAENSRHMNVLNPMETPIKEGRAGVYPLTRRANLALPFPNIPSHGELPASLKDLEGMIDLSRTVVVVGFSELGPWGNARTRWEMEHLREFTLEGYVEIAWMMGLVNHFEGQINGKVYVGWVDSQTKEAVQDDEFKQKYHDHILNHTGLRFIEPNLLGGYDPAKKEFLQEVVVEEDLIPFVASKTSAESFKLRFGDKVAIEIIPGTDECQVQVRKGAHYFLPKAVPFDRMVAGLLPSGWDPLKYGIPEDIVQQVDPVTLYALCCVSEALLSAGIEDPYEFYKHIHISELTNCLGTGAGAMLASRGLYRDRYLDRAVQSDILSESFLNTTSAWINMLLLSSSGPIKTPVGACATAIESLEMGCEAIKSGKSKAALVGGYDDFQEEASYEFAQMKATANSTEELDRGRLPREMSRPSTTTRSGFVESAGCGVQIITNAKLALEMGLPIHSIIAYSQIASDREGRSIPAPGQGILTAAKEAPNSCKSNLLDSGYRRRRFHEDIAQIEKNFQDEKATILPECSKQMLQEMAVMISSKIKNAQFMWGNDIRSQDPTIAPIRGALATWGLSIDDIQLVSMHGTSTKANDINEADVINQMMTHLGRRPGNPILAVCQKALTGHPKGAAGAWQLNGCIQMLQSGIVPGNSNADNIDDKLRQYRHIVYPAQAIQMTEVKATMLTSFGFGQKGGVAIAVAPRFLFAAVLADEFEEYRQKVARRERAATTAFVQAILTNSVVKVKNQAPWGKSDGVMSKVFLDPEPQTSLIR